MTTTAPAKARIDDRQGGFFSPYKPGQGFWTRLGTGLGAALIILFTVYFLYSRLPTWVRSTEVRTVDAETAVMLTESARDDATLRVLDSETLGAAGEQVRVTLEHIWLSPQGIWLYVVLSTVAIVLGALAWWLINRPKHAEFLIQTDGEMKKVSWTSRRELIGSTKVVVFFMFFIAFVLFGYDIIFGYLSYFLNVLKISPFSA